MKKDIYSILLPNGPNSSIWGDQNGSHELYRGLSQLAEAQLVVSSPLPSQVHWEEGRSEVSSQDFNWHTITGCWCSKWQLTPWPYNTRQQMISNTDAKEIQWGKSLFNK